MKKSVSNAFDKQINRLKCFEVFAWDILDILEITKDSHKIGAISKYLQSKEPIIKNLEY